MSYKEYLRFNRRLRKVKGILHTVSIACGCAGFCLFMLVAGFADGLTISGFIPLALAAFGLIAIGALAEVLK